MQDMLKKMKEEQLAQDAKRLAAEKARVAQLEAEKAAYEALVAQQAAEKRRKEEISAAEKKARELAEATAAERAKKAKDESDKAISDAKKKADDLEKVKKALEDEAKRNKPDADEGKPPIRFKDALGRKFSFPWRICKTWKVSSRPYFDNDSLKALLTNGPGHGRTDPPSLRASRLRHHGHGRPLRPSRPARRNHPAASLGVGHPARLGGHDGHVARPGPALVVPSFEPSPRYSGRRHG